MSEIGEEEIARAIARCVDEERFADAPAFRNAARAVLALLHPALERARWEADACLSQAINTLSDPHGGEDFDGGEVEALTKTIEDGLFCLQKLAAAIRKP